MTDIKRLLNKTSWTGRELGMLELYNMASMYRQTLEGEDPKPLFDSSRFQKMVNGIRDPEQGRIYNGYLSLHEWLVVAYNIAQTQFQQAQLRFTELGSTVSKALIAEDVFCYVSKLPYIMTQSQYDRLRAERIESYFKGEDGQEQSCNLFMLLLRAIRYYTHQLETAPRKPNLLKAIRKKYIQAPVKSKLILDNYNGALGLGYYILPDGRRSDQMSDEEWQEAITTKAMKEALTKMRTILGGIEYTQTLAAERITAKAKILFNGGTEEDADREQSRREQEQGLSMPVKWKQYTDPPEDLNKWDIIEDTTALNELYPAYPDKDDPQSYSDFTAAMQDFYTEFKELTDLLLKDMDSRYHLKAAQIKIQEWGSYAVSLRELYDMDFYGERAEAESDAYVFDGNRRALFNGVAIVRPSDVLRSSLYIDKESGDYKPPELNCSIANASLEAFFTDAEDFASEVDSLNEARQILTESYYFVNSYNYIIGRISEIYSVSALDVFCLPTKRLANRIAALNDLVPMLYKQILDTDYSDKDRQAKKLKVLQDYFQPIECEKLVMPEADKAKIEDLIKDFQTFKANSNELFSIMHHLPSGEESQT